MLIPIQMITPLYNLCIVLTAKTAVEIKTIKKKQTPVRFSITYFSKIFSEKGYIKDDISVIS